MHPIRFPLSGELENRRRKRSLIRSKSYSAACLLARRPDDERDVDGWPSQIRALMSKYAALKTFAMIGRDDNRSIAQFPALFEFRKERAEGTVGAQDELVIKQASAVHLALLVGIVMRPPTRHGFILVFSLFFIRQKTSAVCRIGNIRVVRSDYVDPHEKSVRQIGEHFPGVFKTRVGTEPKRVTLR